MNPVVSVEVSADSYPEDVEDGEVVVDLDGIADLVGVEEARGVEVFKVVGVLETVEDADENSAIISRVKLTTQ